MQPLPEEAFRRYDESPDEEFYLLPRFVTHIDQYAIAAVTQLYREFFPPGGEILDLMSSWISHLPPEVEYRRVIGIGMNEAREEFRGGPIYLYFGVALWASWAVLLVSTSLLSRTKWNGLAGIATGCMVVLLGWVLFVARID